MEISHELKKFKLTERKRIFQIPKVPTCELVCVTISFFIFFCMGKQSMNKTALAKTLPGRGSTSPTSTTSSSSGVSSAGSSHLSSSLASSKSCDRIHAVGRRADATAVRRRDKSLDSHVKYRTDSKSAKGDKRFATRGHGSNAICW